MFRACVGVLLSLLRLRFWAVIFLRFVCNVCARAGVCVFACLSVRARAGVCVCASVCFVQFPLLAFAISCLFFVYFCFCLCRVLSVACVACLCCDARAIWYLVM